MYGLRESGGDAIYQSQGQRPTNLKGNDLILGLLTAGKSVEILALPDNGLLY